MVRAVSLLTVCAAVVRHAAAGEIAACPGEGDRYGDHKCNHDPTHRVCAQLLDTSGEPLSWGKGDFWEITGQKDFQWDDKIREQNGDSWCICMWATAKLINMAGCDNVHLHCNASDVEYVMSKYSDGGTDLTPARECLEKKCGGGAPAVQEKVAIASVPVVEARADDAASSSSSSSSSRTMLVAGVAALAILGGFGYRSVARSGPHPLAEE